MAKIAVIGTGLIGTSLALALKAAQIKNLELVGTDYDHAARSGAAKRHAFDRVENRVSSAVRDANIVILATPIMAMQDMFQVIATELSEGCIVTDVGSSKKVILDWAAQYLPKGVEFVGGHPMAGKETRGPEAADADLFRGKAYCIVPGAGTGQQAVSEVTTLAEAIGARPFFVGVDEHDSYVAAASHLPFLVSVALMGCTSKSENWEDIAQLASTGYKDITRLASGDPTMHRDICVSNPEPIVAWIDRFIRELYEVRKLLDNGEGPAAEDVKQVFEQANDARTKWLAGLVTPMARQQASRPEIPTFSETMGQMFVGRKGMDMQRRFFKDLKDPDRKER
jgi:prephenate dehydrogenase